MRRQSAPATVMGPVERRIRSLTRCSRPMGQKILATYSTLKTTWLFDADGGNGHEVAASSRFRGETWQRLAP